MRPAHPLLRRAATPLVAVVLALGIAGTAATQAASSPGHFLVGGELAPGGDAVSPGWRLTGSFGSGVTATRAVSANHVLVGGFVAGLDASVPGRPWLTGAVPRYAPYHGGLSVSLHGTELSLGATTTVALGATPAAVTSRARDQVAITVPAGLAPGWRAVALTNSGGTALLPRGVGILPMAEKNRAVAMGEPFRITYRGFPGDVVFLAVATHSLPFAITIPPYHHGLELNPASLIGLLGPLPVTGPAGDLNLNFPGITFTRPVAIQMLGLHTRPALGPGSFTNVLDL